MASQDWLEKDFYAILGVPADADDAAIKKAYRKLARTYHPDQNAGDAAAEKKFKDIGEAHSVLSDKEQRREYDAVRQMMRGGPRFTAAGNGGSAGASGFEDIFSAFGGQGGGASGMRFSTGGGAEPDLEDILAMFGAGAGAAGGAPFGGGGFPGQGGHQAARGPRKGPDLTARTTMTFREAVQGTTVTLSADGEKITTRIPAGVKDGQRIRLRGKGGPGQAGGPRGDLLLTVTVGSHPVFGRDGNNLTIDLPVTFSEAALGATVEVPTLDGQVVKVKLAPGTPSGRVLRVKGRGVKTKTATGDLLVKVAVVVPEALNDAARAAVESLREHENSDPRKAVVEQAKV